MYTDGENTAVLRVISIQVNKGLSPGLFDAGSMKGKEVDLEDMMKKIQGQMGVPQP